MCRNTGYMRPRVSPGILFPGLFVVLWSTGFIGAKLGLPYAEPATFLVLRFLLVQRLGKTRQNHDDGA